MGESSGTGVGLILAAGAGTRYGMPKVLAEGGAWLDAAVSAVRGAGCGEVLVVLGAAHPDLPTSCTAVDNPAWAEGMGTSLRAGLSACERIPDAAWALVHVVDTPDIGPAVARRILARGGSTGLARAVFDGRPGHPVFMARRHWASARESARGDVGARTFLRGNPELVGVECGDLASGRDHDYQGGGPNDDSPGQPGHRRPRQPQRFRHR